MIRRISTMLVAATLVAACTTTDPYSREERTSRATIGAGIGAVIGAVAGAATGDDAHERRKRALIGAGVGALAGGAVGGYMDAQERKLLEELEGTGVSVTRVGDNIVLNMPGHVTFATGNSDLNPRFFDVLDSVAVVLQEFDRSIVDVSGHTDTVGGREMNQRLSEDRASTVATYLHRRDIIADRFLTYGYAYDRPVASNATAEGRQQNRRVEIMIAPITN
jgi:outer membrane protein OmpA-like peptidoglycan-associated protein